MTSPLARKRQAAQHFEIIRLNAAEDAQREAAAAIRDYITSARRPVLGLATGRTMLPVYAWLCRWFDQKTLSFRDCTSFNLDEYCGLKGDDPSSFAAYMRRNLFDHVDMASDRFNLPQESCPAAFDDLIEQTGGIGLQLLGIGLNGHIGFNEPGTDQNSRTHLVKLAASTRSANAADFPVGVSVPSHAVTMGIATILDAQRILLLATGAAKAEALRRAFLGPVSADCPASYLQLHSHVTVICDSAAAELLEEPS